MGIEAWWPMLRRESKEWLIANNGDELRHDISAEIVRAGGEVRGSYLPDADVDWVEAVGNGEVPDPPITPPSR
jgi:hypothetical protein